MRSGRPQRSWRLSGAVALLTLLPATSMAQQRIRLPADDRPLALRPVEVFRVGRAEGEEWETFSGVQAVAFDADDNLYILDSGNHRIHIFDRDGRHVRSIGRRGEGPGELGMPVGMAVTDYGEILLADPLRSGLQRFARDGAPLASIDMGAHRLTGSVRAHPRGGVLGLARSLPTRTDGLPPPPTRELRWWQDGAGEPRLIYTGPPQPTTQVGAQQLVMQVPLALAPALHWAAMPDGAVAVNAGEEYRIDIIGDDGRVRRILERPIAPRRVTDRDREAYRASRGRGHIVVGGAGNVPAGAIEQLQAGLDNVEFHDRIQVIRALAVDPFGRAWIMRSQDVTSPTGPIDLIDADGGYMGTLPPQPLPAAFSASGRIAYIERDDDDIPRVVVHQVPHTRR